MWIHRVVLVEIVNVGCTLNSAEASAPEGERRVEKGILDDGHVDRAGGRMGISADNLG